MYKHLHNLENVCHMYGECSGHFIQESNNSFYLQDMTYSGGVFSADQEKIW